MIAIFLAGFPVKIPDSMSCKVQRFLFVIYFLDFHLKHAYLKKIILWKTKDGDCFAGGFITFFPLVCLLLVYVLSPSLFSSG